MDEADLDFDGKFDLSTYYVAGKKVRQELAMNFARRVDIWKFFEEEKLVRIESDTNGDGKVDRWEYYEGGKLDRIGYDTTGSGKVDRWDRAPENEEGGGEAAAPAGRLPRPPRPHRRLVPLRRCRGQGRDRPGSAPTSPPSADSAERCSCPRRQDRAGRRQHARRPKTRRPSATRRPPPRKN